MKLLKAFLPIGFIFLVSACESPPESSNKSAKNSSDIENLRNSLPDAFKPQNVCHIAKQTGLPIVSSLGGGTWSKWGDSSLGYSCIGDKSSIDVYKETYQGIQIEFMPMGNEAGAMQVATQYDVKQPHTPIAIEKQERQKYLIFCDAIAQRLLNGKLSEKLKKRIYDTAGFTPSGVADKNPYAEQLGSGYVQMSGHVSTNHKSIKIDVLFYPSPETFRKFKDF